MGQGAVEIILTNAWRVIIPMTFAVLPLRQHYTLAGVVYVGVGVLNKYYPMVKEKELKYPK